jgi:hypothetical protein
MFSPGLRGQASTLNDLDSKLPAKRGHFGRPGGIGTARQASTDQWPDLGENRRSPPGARDSRRFPSPRTSPLDAIDRLASKLPRLPAKRHAKTPHFARTTETAPGADAHRSLRLACGVDSRRLARSLVAMRRPTAEEQTASNSRLSSGYAPVTSSITESSSVALTKSVLRVGIERSTLSTCRFVRCPRRMARTTMPIVPWTS